jgi:acid phosphatase family membrane protein YuiD
VKSHAHGARRMRGLRADIYRTLVEDSCMSSPGSCGKKRHMSRATGHTKSQRAAGGHEGNAAAT